MDADEIICGRSYWVTHGGKEANVKVRSRVRGKIWICEADIREVVLLLPLSAFLRAVVPV
jgi:hypothetical protein